MIRFICSASLLLLFLIGPNGLLAQSDDKAKKGDDVDSKVLEERIKQNKEKTQVQLEAIEKEVEIRNDAVKQEMERRTIELENRMDLYIWGSGIFFVLMGSLITFMGRKAIANWIRQTIEAKTIDELEAVWKERMSTLDKDRGEYERLMNSLKDRIGAIDISKPIPAKSAENLVSLEDKREKLKEEADYSFDDWGYKALGEYDKRQYAEAIISWRKALEINPQSSDIHYSIGVAHTKLENYEQSIAGYTKAIDLNPKYTEAYNNRGHCYSMLKQYDKASSDYPTAIRLAPSDITAYLNMAELMTITARYGDALQYLNTAMSLATELKDKASCLYLTCIVHKLLEMNTSESEREFDKILEEDFDVTWLFFEIDRWLQETALPENTKRFIITKTDLLKKKKGGQ